MGRIPVEQRRKALIAAALRVVASRGLAGASTRAIVTEAGMSLASFHYAFESRDELIEQLIPEVIASEELAILPEAVVGSMVDLLTEGLMGYLDHLRAEGYRVYAVEQVEGAVMLGDFRAEPGVKYALVFGNESRGLPAELRAQYRERLFKIPMPGEHARSINLANAAAIAAYEAYRQFTR